MHVRCPHCHQPVKVLERAGLERIDCPSCGSGFNVPGDATTAFEPERVLQEAVTNPADAETIDRLVDAAQTLEPVERRAFGEYELLAEVARGGMGVVYKARQTRLNRTVAVKMILAGELAGKNDVERFLAEAEAAAGLDHPGIVPVYESGEMGGQHFFSMGFIEGQSLAALLAGGPLPPRRAAELLAQVADAVEYAHQRGVIHRDLKPGNILLDQEGKPRVTDFGLAKRVSGDSGLTRTGQALGTPSYMPPEQAAGKLDAIGRAADVYALGAVLYAAITGRPPFQAATPLDTILQVLEQEPVAPRQLNADVPRDLETIALKCLQKEPHKRYAQASDLADELRRFLRGEPIHARPIGRTERAWRWCRRNRSVAGLAASVVVALLAGAGVSTYFAIEAHYRALEASHSAAAALAAEAREKQRRQAETAAKNEARAAIDRYVDAVFEDQFLKDVRFQPLRKRLLSDALGYYKTFIESHEHDTSERLDLARVLRRVGSISRDTGTMSDAVAAYTQAAELYQKISTEEPSVPGYRNELAVIYNSIGVLHRNSGDKSAAEALFVRSRDISEQLVADCPAVAKYQSNLAYTCHNLAMLEGDRGEIDAARADYRRAIEIENKLIADYPETADYRCDLARHYYNRGILEHHQGQRVAAREDFQRAIKLAEELVAEHPENPEYHSDLARICHNFGRLEVACGELVAARANYRRAIAIASNLAGQHPAVAAFRAELAGDYYAGLGQLESASGQTGAARAAYQSAVEIAERLVAEDPTTLHYRRTLASACSELARLQFTGGEIEPARTNFQRAIQLLEKLAAEEPAVADDRFELARLYHTLGYLQQGRGEVESARSNYQQAIEIDEKLVGQKPSVSQYRGQLAHCYNSLGLLETNCGEPEARGHLQRALEIRQKLAAEQPANSPRQIEVAGTHCNLGNALRNEGEADAALDHYALAATALEGVLAQEPQNATARLFLRNTCWGRAETLMALDRWLEAAQAWRRALELNVAAETAIVFQLELAKSLARSGDHASAAKEAEALASTGRRLPDDLYKLADVLSLCSAASSDDDALRDRYAEQSLELLKRAQAAGFFNNLDNVARFEKDFSGLLQSDGFRQFSDQVSKPGTPDHSKP